MPPVGISARAFVVAACLAGWPAAAHARPAEGDVQRRDELDAVQRQDVADALRLRFGISVDWRTTPLDRLLDIRLRAGKAADLQARLGVSVDWQRYSWVELEALRRTLLSFEGGSQRNQPLPPPSVDALVQPKFKPMPVRPEPRGASARPADPDAIIRPTFSMRPEPGRITSGGDPDAVIRPTFAARAPSVPGTIDPDGLITPTFAPRRRFMPAAIRDPDDLIAPLEPVASPAAAPATVAPPARQPPPVLWAPPAPPLQIAPPAPARW
jgi:hypothetical protein